MRILAPLADWLDVRPDEVRPVLLSFFGAFLVISFLILARSLREALYLTTFPVETLPYIMAAVAFLSVPTVGLFARFLARRQPQRVLIGLLALLAAGLAALWPVATRVHVAVVAFYLWTALGTLLLTSGFWLVTAELFPVRGAKRLFGLIGAGGTVGAMVMGNSLAWITTRAPVVWLIPGLILLLALFFVVQRLLPRLEARADAGPPAESRTTLRDSLHLVWKNSHLRNVGLVVFAATVASALIDYQFKELAQASLATKESLTSFFGSFYGWTGAAALLLQLFVSARLMASAGIAITLAVLPLALLLGSAGLLLAPGLVMATAVRGTDNSLRKSLHRSALEVLYVPVPARLRRRTKTFIDSVMDSVAEGTGALIVFLWVTWSGLPSRFLSLHAVAAAGAFLFLSRRMGRRYVATVTDQLRAGRQAREPGALADQRDLLSVGFTRVDIRPALEETGITTATADLSAIAQRALADVLPPARDEALASATEAARGIPFGLEASPGPADPLESLRSPDSSTVLAALQGTEAWDAQHVPALARLLARDTLYPRAVEVLCAIGEPAVPHLSELLCDDRTDFAIRRRIPRILARSGGEEADSALLGALAAPRFEVRYRAAIALARRRRQKLPAAGGDWRSDVWAAVRHEVSRERPVWELQRLLDGRDDADDALTSSDLESRGALSLEHTFRLLALVLDPQAVEAAFMGATRGEERLRSLALEYLEQVLPADVRNLLWPFIGDLSERRRARQERPLEAVVSDLVTTGATFFASEAERERFRRYLDEERKG